MTVYLVALGADRFELYSEPVEDPVALPGADAGWWRRWGHTAGIRWRDLVDAARRGEAPGRVGRWRDAMVCHLAESIAEQRTLWALRKADAAALMYPSSIDADAARRALDRSLAASRWHHGVWLTIDTLLFIVSGFLALIPGPNVLAYYLAFRVIGHAQSCLGVYRGMTRVAWTVTPDDHLAELATLIRVPHAARVVRVEAIAAALRLHRLGAYFERVAR